MTNDQNGFAPSAPTDGRKIGDWKSRYEKPALKKIHFEALYLGILFFIVPILIFFIHNNFMNSLVIDTTTCKYAISWLGGTFGGTIFGIKWLYHTVAKFTWNEDRRMWRIFTPHISGGFSFVIIVLISSGILTIFSRDALCSQSSVFGLSFLSGYFSDSAVGKLTELANALFGATEKSNPTKT